MKNVKKTDEISYRGKLLSELILEDSKPKQSRLSIFFTYIAKAFRVLFSKNN